MRKTITAGKGKAQAWFDAEYRESRKDMRHHLRNTIKAIPITKDYSATRREREYKELLRVGKKKKKKKEKKKKEQRTVKKYWTLYTGRVQTQQKSGASLSHI